MVTNPPFSLFREYIAQLIEYDKRFLIIGHQNAIHYKAVFPLIQGNKLWLGYGFKRNMAHFMSHYEDTAADLDHKEGMIRVLSIHWFTNIDMTKRHEELILYKRYNPDDYPRYDNFDAIEVGKTVDIPMDYAGIMGVPTTFLEKYNPDEYEVVGITESWYGGASKIYPRHNTGQRKWKTQCCDETQRRRRHQSCHSAAPPRPITRWKQYYTKAYARILIRHKGKPS